MRAAPLGLRSVADLNHRICAFVDGWSQQVQPFFWTKTAEQILVKADRKKTSGATHCKDCATRLLRRRSDIH